MVEKTDYTRPQTDADFVTFTNGNSKKNNEALCKWIADKEIKRSQIIALTTNETEIEEGDHMVTMFYREKPSKPHEAPLDNIKFHSFN